MTQEEIFKEAIHDNGESIYNICCHFFGPGDEAEDAYQEILLKIWLNIKSFRGESQLKTWMIRIASNVCLTYIAKRKKRASVFVPISSVDYYENPDDTGVSTEEEEVKIKFFRTFNERLNPLDKTLVALYLEDIAYREMSHITGLSEVNARARIHRIKKQINKEWEEEYGTR